MTRALLITVTLLLGGCGQRSTPDENAVQHASAEPSAGQCTPPTLALADGARSPGSSLLDETRGNFAAAYKRACAKGVLKAGPLIDVAASDQEHLFLINAPDANVASIYLSEIDGNRMMLEYPFLTTDGKSQVPSADELEEAIYCAVVGATPDEQESSGRCLVD